MYFVVDSPSISHDEIKLVFFIASIDPFLDDEVLDIGHREMTATTRTSCQTVNLLLKLELLETRYGHTTLKPSAK
jgi:hypothetical protein